MRHRNEAILDIARALRLPLDDLPEFPPRHWIGIKQPGLILRRGGDGPLLWSWAQWSIVPPGGMEPPAYPLNNARSDTLNGWPWKMLQRRRCLIPVSGFWEPEKPARAPSSAPWFYNSMQDNGPLLVAGLWSDAPDPATGEIADGYTMVIGKANAATRLHDRMPAILGTDAARRGLEPGPLPTEPLAL
ncbi:MAG: SOS response-associated peptidase family protein, partial [Geminicoccaceae bacterium]